MGAWDKLAVHPIQFLQRFFDPMILLLARIFKGARAVRIVSARAMVNVVASSRRETWRNYESTGAMKLGILLRYEFLGRENSRSTMLIGALDAAFLIGSARGQYPFGFGV